MSAAKEAMKTALATKLYNIWKAQADKATQDGMESEDPDTIINKMANDVAEAVSSEVETYVAQGFIIPAGATPPGGGTVTFAPTTWYLTFT